MQSSRHTNSTTNQPISAVPSVQHHTQQYTPPTTTTKPHTTIHTNNPHHKTTHNNIHQQPPPQKPSQNVAHLQFTLLWYTNSISFHPNDILFIMNAHIYFYFDGINPLF